MAVHIRLTRVGATRRPAYRVIAIDSRRSRDGRALEILGFYDPLTDPITVKLDDERIANRMARGALPSAAVQRLMKVALAGPVPKRKPAPAAEGAAVKPRRASRAKQTAAEAAAEPAAETTEAATETAAGAAEETAAEIAPLQPAEVTAEAAPEPTQESMAEATVDAEQPEAEPAAETDAEATAETAEAAAESADETEGKS